MTPGQNVPAIGQVDVATKVFMTDSSVLLFQKGFTVAGDTLQGNARTYSNGQITLSKYVRVATRDISAMSSYYSKSSGGTGVGSAVLGVYGSIMVPLSVVCTIDPKGCFGSCPTIYSVEESGFKMDAELFSYSVSKFFQESDLDRIGSQVRGDTTFQLRLTNEALETHYINQFSLVAVEHPFGTHVYASPDNEIILTTDLRSPSQATNSLSEDVLPALLNKDKVFVRSPESSIHAISEGRYTDWIELSLPVKEQAETVKLVLRLRNTLLSTVLFYDVVLASQGIEAINWTHRMNTDSMYAALYNQTYKQFAGIRVMTLVDGAWTQSASIGDIGPIAWKETGLSIPAIRDNNGIMKVRLEFFPDNFMIDQVRYEVSSSTETGETHEYKLDPVSVTDADGLVQSEFGELVSKDDNDYLITFPGDHYLLDYAISTDTTVETSLFVRSKGYYTEWVRASWIRREKDDYTFNLFNPVAVIMQLQKRWLEKKESIEKTFFETRIPLRGES